MNKVKKNNWYKNTSNKHTVYLHLCTVRQGSTVDNYKTRSKRKVTFTGSILFFMFENIYITCSHFMLLVTLFLNGQFAMFYVMCVFKVCILTCNVTMCWNDFPAGENIWPKQLCHPTYLVRRLGTAHLSVARPISNERP